MGKQRLLLALASAREQELLSGAFRGLEEIEVLPPAGDGDEVLRLLAQGCVDILVLEIMFRGAHGEPVLEAIQRLPEQRRPLLFLITPYSEDRLLAPWADDAVRCFVKPYLPELLVLRVLQEATQSERRADCPSLSAARLSLNDALRENCSKSAFRRTIADITCCGTPSASMRKPIIRLPSVLRWTSIRGLRRPMAATAAWWNMQSAVPSNTHGRTGTSMRFTRALAIRSTPSAASRAMRSSLPVWPNMCA